MDDDKEFISRGCIFYTLIYIDLFHFIRTKAFLIIYTFHFKTTKAFLILNFKPNLGAGHNVCEGVEYMGGNKKYSEKGASKKLHRWRRKLEGH